MEKTGRSFKEWRVAVLKKMEATSNIKSWRSSSISVNRIWAAAETNNGQDRQVHEGVEGGRLEEDGGNIKHQVMAFEFDQCKPHLGGG
jgi:hypothetical protein